MIKSLIANLKTYIIAGGAFLLAIFMYKNEKNKRVQAESDRDTANANVDLLVRREEVITDIDMDKEDDAKIAAAMLLKQKTQLEKVKYEDDDRSVVDTILGLSNKSNREIQESKNTK